MTGIELKIKFLLLFIFSYMLLFPVLLNAQITNGNKSSEVEIYPVKKLADELKKDVNLTDKQTADVMKFLKKYEVDTYNAKGDNVKGREAAQDTQENIAEVLTDTQKNDWRNVKSQWWASVDKHLNLTNLKSPKKSK